MLAGQLIAVGGAQKLSAEGEGGESLVEGGVAREILFNFKFKNRAFIFFFEVYVKFHNSKLHFGVKKSISK